MKIRTDFVTNSSSVSFILTMDLDIVNCFLDIYKNEESMQGLLRLAESLRNYIMENGNLNYLHEHKIYSCLMEFSDDDGSCITKEILDENGENADPLKMSEEELFNYLRGEFIYARKLSGFLNGFGATQVEQY